MIPKKILVIDDEVSIGQLVKIGLEARGHIVEIATSQEEGIEKLKGFYADVILLDFMMPGMSGYEFLDKLSADKSISEVPPVIFVSVIAPDIKSEALKKEGVCDIIPKPIDFEQLASAIDKIGASYIRMRIKEKSQPTQPSPSELKEAIYKRLHDSLAQNISIASMKLEFLLTPPRSYDKKTLDTLQSIMKILEHSREDLKEVLKILKE